jgi:capsular exopolysaccharide synthesis family protein
MREGSTLDVLWRRRWIVLACFLVAAGGAAIISKSLTRIYATSSTLLVVQSQQQQTFDAVQAAQVTARTYSDIITSPNIARRVAAAMGGSTSADEVESAVSVDPVVETQLLKIRAEDPSPRRAKEIADAYAKVVIDYARTLLEPTTRAKVTLADPAPLPDSPTRPKPTLYTLIAGLLGLALGIGLAFLRERLDFRLRSPEDVESRFDVPLLGRIPRRGRTEVSVNAFTEAFRVLRTNLRFASSERPVRTIAVTSSVEGEGKTTTVAQLALASAEIDTRVLAVDADVRRPSLQRELLPDEIRPLFPGFGDYLTGRAGLDAVMHPTPLPNIEFVPTGEVPAEETHAHDGRLPSLARLLETRLGRTAVGGFAAGADLVLFDCPPLSVGADASVIASQVDAVILVIDLQASTERSVRNAMRQLEAVKAPILGIVLNRERTAELHYGYEYHMGAPESRGERVGGA